MEFSDKTNLQEKWFNIDVLIQPQLIAGEKKAKA